MGAKVVVIGSLNMDLSIRVTRLPGEGETLLGQEMTETPGGKGGNQAAAIAKLGVPTAMIAKVGDDANGIRMLQSLRGCGVRTEGVMISHLPTGMAWITVDHSGHNHIVVTPGANNDLTCEDIDRQRHLIEQCEAVVLQLEIPCETAAYALELAKSLGKLTILNPAPAMPLEAALLSCVDLLIPNEHELQVMSGVMLDGEAGLREAVRRLTDAGAGRMIVTRGAEGCVYAGANQWHIYSAHKVAAKDTTAAGDSFIGGLVAEYLETGSLGQAIRYAQRAAAVTVTRSGAQQALPTRLEIALLDYGTESGEV